MGRSSACFEVSVEVGLLTSGGLQSGAVQLSDEYYEAEFEQRDLVMRSGADVGISHGVNAILAGWDRAWEGLAFLEARVLEASGKTAAEEVIQASEGASGGVVSMRPEGLAPVVVQRPPVPG